MEVQIPTSTHPIRDKTALEEKATKAYQAIAPSIPIIKTRKMFFPNFA